MAVWKITEDVNTLRNLLHMFPHETFKFESRNLHWLASRVVLQELLKDKARPHSLELLKHSNGRPYIKGLECHISLSHSGIYAAVIMSKTQRVGVDIEEITPRIKKIAHKFINEIEQPFVKHEDDLDTLYLIWAAKEAIFKLYGKGEVDFKKHMEIDLSQPGETYPAILEKDDETLHLTVNTQVIEGYRLCLVAEPVIPAQTGI